MYAQWSVNSYTVTWVDGNGAAIYSEQVAYGTTPTYNTATYKTPEKIATEQNSYSFTNWSPAIVAVSGDATYTAQFSSSINNYTVTFDKNGGTRDASPASKSITYNDTIGELPTAPERTGYTFNGWNSKSDGTGEAVTDTTVITGNITAYAQWNVNGYTVTFDKNGGDTNANPVSKSTNYNTALGSLPTAPEKTGYTFIGWKTEASGSGSAFTATTVVTGDITVYAQWSINSYTITYSNNTGIGIAPQDNNRYNYGSNANILFTPTPTKNGYVFTGWSKNSNAIIAEYTLSGVKSITNISSNITLYAVWALNPVDNKPVAGNDYLSAVEDTVKIINPSDLLRNDSDPDHNKLTLISITSQDPNGTVTLSPNGKTITFEPAKDFNGTYTFEYTVSDGKGGTAKATVTITVEAVNDAPVANSDIVDTNKDVPKHIESTVLLTNDTDVDGDTLTVISVSGTSTKGGTVTLENDGKVLYTPSIYYVGSDTFTYTISDGNGGTSSAIVKVSVSESSLANTNPVAVDDSFTTDVGIPLYIDTVYLLENDTDAETAHDSLILVSVDPAQKGTVYYNGKDTIIYTAPTKYYSGDDTFTYTITDGNGGYSSATVTVKVNAAFNIIIKPEPASIVGNGKDKTLLTAKVENSAGDGIEGVVVNFATSMFNADGSFMDLNEKPTRIAITNDKGIAQIYYKSTNLESLSDEPSIFNPLKFDVYATADDDALGLHAQDSFEITFAPGTLKGIMYDGTTKLTNKQIVVTLDNEKRKWSKTIFTNENGEYSTYVPWSGETYTVSVVKTIQVKDENGNAATKDVVFTQQGKTDSEAVGEGGTYDSYKTITGIVMKKDEIDSTPQIIKR